MNDKNFDIAFEQLIQREGGYTDGKNQISDQPTNMGITQTTLNNYLKKNPTSDMPRDVKYLTMFHARTIYKDLYWDNTKIPQIENARVRNVVFDMSVMSGPTIPAKTLQQTLNEYIGANLPKTGYLGNQTIKAINSIPANMVNDFMTALIENRMHSLQKMSNWATAKNGWTRRTMGY